MKARNSYMLRKKLLTIALSGLLGMAIYTPAKAAGSISEIDQKIDTVQYETTDGLDDLGCNYQTADELIANLAQYEEESSELSVQSVDCVYAIQRKCACFGYPGRIS